MGLIVREYDFSPLQTYIREKNFSQKNNEIKLKDDPMVGYPFCEYPTT